MMNAGNNLSRFASHFAIHYCALESCSTSCVALFANQCVLCHFTKLRNNPLVAQSLRYMKFHHSKTMSAV